MVVAVVVVARGSAVCEVEARGSGGGACPGGSGGMPSAKRALATLGEGAGGRRILSRSWRAGASPVTMPELPGGGGDSAGLWAPPRAK